MIDDDFIQEANRLEYIDPELLGSLLDVEMAHASDPLMDRCTENQTKTLSAFSYLMYSRVPTDMRDGSWPYAFLLGFYLGHDLVAQHGPLATPPPIRSGADDTSS